MGRKEFEMLEKIKNYKWGYALIATVLAVLGICFIAFHEALKILAITIGVILCVFSLVFAVLTIADKRRGFAFGFRIFFCVICLIGGIVTAVFNEGTVDIMISVFSLLIVVDGAFKLHTSAMSRRYRVVGWWLIMVLAALGIVGGFLLIKFTPEETDTASVLIGLLFAVDAIANFLSSFYVAGFEHRMENEIRAEVTAENGEARALTEGDEDRKS